MYLKNLLLHYKKQITLLTLFILVLQIILHLISYQYPFLYEDEALYLSFGQSGNISLDSGILWYFFTKINMNLFSGSELKILPLFSGLLSAFSLFLIMRKGLKLELYISLIFTILYVSSPIFFSQAHRIRPEILHVSLSLISLVFYIYSYLKNSKTLLLIASFCFISIIHTHIMGLLNMPGLYLVVAYIFYEQTKSIQKTLLSLVCIILLQILILYYFIPSLFSYSVHHFDAFETNSLFGLFKKSWYSFLISFKVWYWDLRGSSYQIINSLFSAGYHLTLEGVILYIESLVAGLILIVYIYKKRRVSLPIIVSLGAAINCVCYFLAIVVFRRINNSYNIILLPWMIISIASCFYDFEIKNNKFFQYVVQFYRYIIIVTTIFLAAIYSVHIYKYIFPLRNTNFNSVLSNLKEEAKKNNCKNFSFVSCPYFIFFDNTDGKHPTAFGDVIASYNEKFNSKYKEQLMSNDTCLAVIARNYYGYDWWGQYFSSVSKLNKVLDNEFKIVSKISMPFYKNDPFYPYIKQNKDNIQYPIGADTIYFGGQETIWLMKNR